MSWFGYGISMSFYRMGRKMFGANLKKRSSSSYKPLKIRSTASYKSKLKGGK